ncbi:hypothetical protein NSPZN2_50078 [Nitrospira defluvii]|uniref:Uncharacterized protein n=1 Tax=Nitrospira defluvii TaxID=330214 RepID=A0ABN7M7Q4_9BACT|nr:hypothetical protein NSPZN2_50078 [Nitrospira defluvii]
MLIPASFGAECYVGNHPRAGRGVYQPVVEWEKVLAAQPLPVHWWRQVVSSYAQARTYRSCRHSPDLVPL